MNTTPADFEVKESQIAGLGVFAISNIPANTFLCLKPRGVTVGVERHKDDIPKEYIGYCIATADDLYQCPADYSNMEPVWYLNHSKNPNAEQRHDGYYSKQQIRAGEEITINYNTLGEPEDKKEAFYKD